MALVTGGAIRVGRAIVERLSEAGFDVAFTYWSSEQQAKDLAESHRALPIRADLTQSAAAVEVISKSLSSFADRLDVFSGPAECAESGIVLH